jgi:hypothetical protein
LIEGLHGMLEALGSILSIAKKKKKKEKKKIFLSDITKHQVVTGPRHRRRQTKAQY